MGKPILNVKNQVNRLKDKGVLFNTIGEEDAEQYLTNNNYYYKLTSFRKNFPKHISGVSKGKYINLEFAYLVDLAILDSYLRNIILEVSLDIEHYSKLSLLHELENRETGDGCLIVLDFFKSLGTQRVSLENRINEKKDSSYVGNIIKRYKGQYPAWAFIEIISFGDYLRFYKYCANRWCEKAMIDNYYRMRDVKELRNAAAHNNCIINDITTKATTHNANYALIKSLSAIKKRSNSLHLKKEKVRQIATLFYVSSYTITSDGVKSKIKKLTDQYKERIFRDYSYSFNPSLHSTLQYLIKVIDIFY